MKILKRTIGLTSPPDKAPGGRSAAHTLEVLFIINIGRKHALSSQCLSGDDRFAE